VRVSFFVLVFFLLTLLELMKKTGISFSGQYVSLLLPSKVPLDSKLGVVDAREKCAAAACEISLQTYCIVCWCQAKKLIVYQANKNKKL